MDDPYLILGVTPSDSDAAIRAAYRRLARANHPDVRGGDDNERMSAINAAWHVLGNSGRRRVFDQNRLASQPQPTASAAANRPGPTTFPDRSASAAPHSATQWVEPAKFPWRFMAFLASVGIVLVAVGVVTSRGQQPTSQVDSMLVSGSCVIINERLQAVEVLCTAANDGLVIEIIDFDQVCVYPAEPFLDPLGRGWACVQRGGPTTTALP